MEVLDLYATQDFMLKNTDKIGVIFDNGEHETFKHTDLDSVIVELFDVRGIKTIQSCFAV